MTFVIIIYKIGKLYFFMGDYSEIVLLEVIIMTSHVSMQLIFVLFFH